MPNLHGYVSEQISVCFIAELVQYTLSKKFRLKMLHPDVLPPENVGFMSPFVSACVNDKSVVSVCLYFGDQESII